jgi:hypothetical protein
MRKITLNQKQRRRCEAINNQAANTKQTQKLLLMDRDQRME